MRFGLDIYGNYFSYARLHGYDAIWDMIFEENNSSIELFWFDYFSLVDTNLYKEHKIVIQKLQHG